MTTNDREALRRRYEQRLELLVPADKQALAALPLFADIPEKIQDRVLEKTRPYVHFLPLAPGEVALREGDYSDSAYYVVSGEVEVFLGARGPGERRPVPRGGTSPGGTPGAGAGRGAEAMLGRGHTLPGFPGEATGQRAIVLAAGEIFGEMGALSRYPVSATVRARGAARLLRLRLPGLRLLMAAAPGFKRKLDERYRERTLGLHLRRVGLFADFTPDAIAVLRQKADLLAFAPGDVIASEGEPAAAFYLVRGGYVKLSVSVADAELAVTYLRAGDFAGEAGLVLDQRWPFTLQAVENVELVKLDRADFAAALSGHKDLQGRLWRETVARLKARGSAARDPVASEYLQMAIDTGLIHGESVLLIDLATCTRCDDCVQGCADTHGGQAVFVREGTRYKNWLVPTSCYQCTDPVCMMDCPTGAITRAVGTLEVTVNASTCIGCSNCAKNCPWGNILMVETGETRSDGKPVEVSAKCDLCVGQTGGPVCVRSCPHGSARRVSFRDLEEIRAALR